ncbi:MAG: DEAD/DEAH box helicase family protein [Bacteroidales bacterium]|jgi:type III restriction enzyme|nr:DEAD/DEAH box helicase family protein [Bacteroidales bacterium]MCI2146066.1 DEAD/DEAH box helicase family protein [Bacteroidales bacterium]
MKFKFKIQQYQTDAVENTVAVFHGQPSHDITEYRRDLGKKRDGTFVYAEEYSGYRNSDVDLSAVQLLDNIRKIQSYSDIPQSDKLAAGLGVCNLDIEMETGTGKTYVYIKTMFELNRAYGWSKFIVVVPSIAIREGVAKSFSMLEDHFMEYYGKKARCFIYNSGNLQQLDSFSSDAGINVMIINTQAFAASMKEGGRSKESRIIYSKRDDFGSRRPIDVIAANRPIVIMDEPQKMGGEVTQTSLKKFNPLFTLYYSATHKIHHNTIYALDALDAYKQKLVKKIQVKGFEVKNLQGSTGYLYLDSFILSKNAAPMVKIDLDISHGGGIRHESHKFKTGDNLYTESDLHEYDGCTISDINPYNNSVTFLNGLTLHKGEVVGDSSELTMQRVQIRETIASHFEKERTLFERGIKTLSLFFVDEVANYKSYDENGNVVQGVFWKIFEEEYNHILNEKISLFDDKYQAYLRRFNASEVHKGYFSIDKKGHAVDSKLKRGETISDDISAYDLILKNKERLLSFDEPVRFIFSHSALREGWDNPNIFQICTLRHANSAIAKRQEVGRGLRLCVDQQGNRIDYETLGENVQDINKLTVVANESYSTFVDSLQKETREDLRERPTKADEAYFEGKMVDINGEKHTITQPEAAAIYTYLWENEYVDDTGRITDNYKNAAKNHTLFPLSAKLQPMTEGIHKLVQSIFDSSINIDDMIENGHETPVDNQLNENFKKEEFQELWKNINHKYVYTVHYNSDELIKKAIDNINKNLYVTELKYIMVTGTQENVDSFGDMSSTTKRLGTVCTSTVKYDLVGEISRGTTITRRTVVEILKGIGKAKLYMFKNNPEEFIHKIIKLIKEQKATMIVEHIGYNQSDETYDSAIFTQEKHSQSIEKAYPAKKSILNYVFTDGLAEESTEKKFAESLDEATEVCVYAKLPRSFQIPTPVGNYAPDWAIAFNKGTVKHIFFVAETKGSLNSLDMRGVEEAKIKCAKKLFNETSTSKVKYWNVTSYEDLLDVMEKI